MTELELYIFTAAGLIALSISVLWPSTNSHLKKTGIPVDGIVLNKALKIQIAARLIILLVRSTTK